jgi:hypothetical protein
VLEPTVLAETGNTGGYTDLYAVRIGMDGFHGVAVSGQPLVSTWLPDFTVAGAVKTGEVEMGFSYDALEGFLANGPSAVTPEEAERIERLSQASAHKRALPPVGPT